MIKSLAIVMRGTLAAQAIGFLMLPLFARLYTPEDFGVFQLYQSIIAPLLVIATLRFEIAILRAKDASELKSVLLLCSGCNIMIFVLVIVAMVLIYLVDVDVGFNYPPLLLFCVPLAFLINGTVQYLIYWLTHDQAFSKSSNAKVVQAIGNASSAAASGLTGIGGIGLASSDIAGKFLALIYAFPWIRRRWNDLGPTPDWHTIKSTAWKFREFPLISVPGGLLNAVGGMLTPIMIYATFSASTSGQFGLVERSLNLPIAIVIVSVSQVFSAQFSEALRQGRNSARQIYHKYLLFLSLAGLVPMIILVAFGPELFALFFGAKWAVAGEFAQLLAPTYSLILLTGGTNMILMLLGMQKAQMIWETARLAAMLTLWTLASSQNWSSTEAVTGHAIVIGISSVIFLLFAELGLRAYERPYDKKIQSDILGPNE